MTKKLKILGPYTPDHPGPFCTRRREPVDLKIRDGRGNLSLIGYVGEEGDLSYWPKDGRYDDTGMSDTEFDLMNAEEAPVAREFWLVGCNMYETREAAEDYIANIHRITLSRLEIIHVREVLPGDGE